MCEMAENVSHREFLGIFEIFRNKRYLCRIGGAAIALNIGSLVPDGGFETFARRQNNKTSRGGKTHEEQEQTILNHEYTRGGKVGW